MIRAAGAALALLAAAGCTTPGAMLAPAPAGLAPRPPAAAPSDIAVIIYSHGSRQELVADRCNPGGDTTPPIVRALAGARVAGLRLAVYADCQPTRRGGFVAARRSGTPKVERRAADIEALVRRFDAVGVPPRRIVFAGHSAGGWASLWAARDGEPPVAGVVAFAPAFAGPERSRSAGWQWLRDVHQQELARAPRIDALVFAFSGDAFETPADLAFLDAVPGVERVTVPPSDDCKGASPHRKVFTDCFAAAHRGRVLHFLGERLEGAATSR